MNIKNAFKECERTMQMTMHQGDLVDFMDDIKHAFHSENLKDRELIQMAITFVRQGMIDDYTYNEAHQTVSASLQNETEDTVYLKFDTKDISCSCSEPNWCVHKIAVVFYLYAQDHSLTDWNGEWRRMETEQLVDKIKKRTPENWNEILSQLMNPVRVMSFNENPAVFTHKFSLIDQKAAALYPFEWEWKPVFDIYYRLHALEAAWPYLAYHLANQANSFSYGKWYVKNWLTEQFEKIEDATRSLSSKRQLFEIDPFYDEIRKMIRTFTLEQTGLFTERFRLYRTFWQSLFAQKSMREQEITILTTVDSPIVQPLLAFFYMIDGQYEKLTEATSSLTLANIGAWFPLAEIADYEEDLEALTIIMQALLPFIPDYAQSYIPRSDRAMFTRKIDGLLEIADFPEEEREKMFFIYGDAGIDVYADFLIERERYREWAALMHRYRVPYEVAEAGGLPIALKDDPVAVFPLLHLYAMRFIAEKNRQSYKRAVRVFRKMKNGAKKSGKHDFWNQYLETIRDKNRRLRALIEEIEKGNLTL